MNRALAIALLGLGLSVAGNAPASATVALMPGLAAPQTADMATPVFFRHRFRCPLDLPVVSSVVAFFELLRDDERDRHCRWRFEGERYYRSYK